MLDKTRRADYINALDLIYAGYKRINAWKYVKKINDKKRWHAIVAGSYIHLHQDTTWTNKWGFKRHQVCLAHISREIRRIREIKNTREMVE